MPFSDIYDNHGLLTQPTSAKHLNPSLDQLWMQLVPPHFPKSFQKPLFVSLQQQKLLNCLHRVQTALHPNLDVRPSTFSKNFDSIFDVLEKV